jgi:DNA-binding winged helix-turn-helix (wHTH) protein
MVQEHHISFGPFRLETTQARLWRGEQAIPLRPRTGAVLQYLATHPGRLVTKTELRQHIWAGTHVTETVLRVCIREIRPGFYAFPWYARGPMYHASVC